MNSSISLSYTAFFSFSFFHTFFLYSSSLFFLFIFFFSIFFCTVSRNIDEDVVYGFGYKSESDWWTYFNSTVHCVRKITGESEGESEVQFWITSCYHYFYLSNYSSACLFVCCFSFVNLSAFLICVWLFICLLICMFAKSFFLFWRRFYSWYRFLILVVFAPRS